MKRLSKREVKNLYSRLGKSFEYKTIYVEDVSGVKMYLFGDKKIPMLAEYKGELIPTLYFKELVSEFPMVIVDPGAARALQRGADLMAPGVRERPENIEEGQRVIILDTEGNIVGLGKALVRELPEKGKVVKMYHVVSEKDPILKAIKILRSKKS